LLPAPIRCVTISSISAAVFFCLPMLVSGASADDGATIRDGGLKDLFEARALDQLVDM
jgi:hypothetical protein